MKSLPLPSQELLRQKFAYADGWLFRDGQRVGSSNGNGYLRVSIRKVHYYVHRLIWVMHNGDIPEGMEIDHINCVRSDNRVENLRLATRMHQSRNHPTHSHCISGLKGAHFNGPSKAASAKPWHSQIIVERKVVYLGHFATAQEAHEAYAAAAAKYFGEFARAA